MVLLQGGLLIGVADAGGTIVDLALACTGLGVVDRGTHALTGKDKYRKVYIRI